jgi:hypothetical protein
VASGKAWIEYQKNALSVSGMLWTSNDSLELDGYEPNSSLTLRSRDGTHRGVHTSIEAKSCVMERYYFSILYRVKMLDNNTINTTSVPTATPEADTPHAKYVHEVQDPTSKHYSQLRSTHTLYVPSSGRTHSYPMSHYKVQIRCSSYHHKEQDDVVHVVPVQ